MVHNMKYSTSILDTIGVLSSLNFADTIWKEYEKYVIRKIEEGTLRLRGSLHYIKELTPKQAKKELNSITPIVPMLSELRGMIDQIDEKEFKKFKDIALEFFETVDLLHDNLQDIAHEHSSYDMAMPVLAKDWDSKEDEHWNKY